MRQHSRKTLPVYDGALRANQIGGFVKQGLAFQIIRPGYDAQGRRRQWTQIVHDGVPIFEMKGIYPVEIVIRRFDDLWARLIGDDDVLRDQALQNTLSSRRRYFRDGSRGEAPAPAYTRDGREKGHVYPS